MKRTENRWMGAICLAVAGTAGLAAALGIFARGDGADQVVTSVRGVTYEMSTSGVYAYNAQRMVAEGVGWDVFTLLGVVPAMLVAGFLVARGSFHGRLLALGLFGYFLYQYLEYEMTWAFGPLFPLFIAISAASLAGLVWIGTSVARDGVDGRFGDAFPGRAFAAASIAMSCLLTLMWAQRIAMGLGGDLQAAGLRGETTMVVQALDLGLVVPASVFIAVLAWRGSAVGRVLASVFVVTSIAMAAAILAMLVSAAMVEGVFELPPMLIFGAYLSVMSLVGVQIYRNGTPRAYPSIRVSFEASIRR